MGELRKEISESCLADAAISEPVTFAVQILLVNLLQMADFEFTFVVNQISGKISAAYTSGILTKANAISISYYPGLHAHFAVSPENKNGGLIGMGLSSQDALDFCELDDFQGRLVEVASKLCDQRDYFRWFRRH